MISNIYQQDLFQLQNTRTIKKNIKTAKLIIKHHKLTIKILPRYKHNLDVFQNHLTNNDNNKNKPKNVLTSDHRC